MSSLLVALAIVVPTLAIGLAGGWLLPPHGRRQRKEAQTSDTGRRILLPFTGTSISRRSLEAAVRLARAEDATIMPAFLATVPRYLPIDAPLPAQCQLAMPLLEAIEQKAIAAGVRVDARVGRGRSYRDALRGVLNEHPVDRIIVSADTNPRTGLTPQDLQWLLGKAPSEVLILRPGPEDHRTIDGATVRGHF
jgi:hypothetical protein